MAKKLTVDDLSNDQKIFVRNHTDGSVNIVLYVGDGSGKTELAFVPKTFIPIQVTEFAPTIMFKNSLEFRKIIRSGALELVSEEDANKILATEDGARELERVRKKYFSNWDYSKDIDDVKPVEVIKDLGNDKVSIKIKDIMLQEVDEDEKLAMLANEFNMKNTSEEDLKFVLTVVDRNSKIARWVNDKLLNGKKLFKTEG